MADEFWTLEAFENAGTKEIEIEGKKVVIKALDPRHLIILFDGQDVNKLEDGAKTMTTEELLKNLDLLDEVVLAGLVKPAVSKETIVKLSRFRQKIATEILKFSGLGEDNAADVEKFREQPDG